MLAVNRSSEETIHTSGRFWLELIYPPCSAVKMNLYAKYDYSIHIKKILNKYSNRRKHIRMLANIGNFEYSNIRPTSSGYVAAFMYAFHSYTRF